MQPTSFLRLNRDVTKVECPWLENDLKAGQILYEYKDHTYGCISPSGMACTLLEAGFNGAGIRVPFFEIPKDAIA